MDEQNGWIRVRKRLPAEFEWVQVTCRVYVCGIVLLRVTEAAYIDGMWIMIRFAGAEVIAWRPLPEPCIE